MKTIAIFGVMGFFVLGMAASLWAYEGGTKEIAVMAFRGENHAVSDSNSLTSQDYLKASKPVFQLIRQMPRPLLSPTRLRQEKTAPSRGAKSVILFHEEGRI